MKSILISVLAAICSVYALSGCAKDEQPGVIYPPEIVLSTMIGSKFDKDLREQHINQIKAFRDGPFLRALVSMDGQPDMPVVLATDADDAPWHHYLITFKSQYIWTVSDLDINPGLTRADDAKSQLSKELKKILEEARNTNAHRATWK